MAEELEIPAGEATDTGLFTDAVTDGGAPMMSGPEFDGADQPTAPVAEPVEGKGGKKLLRIDLGNGHFIVGETERELLEKAVKGKLEADKAVLAREAELKAVRSQPVITQTNVQPQPPAVRTQTEQFNPQKFLNELGENPLEAMRYANNYLDGGNPVVNEKVEYAYNVAQKVDQQLMAAEFHRRNPDWQPTDENASKLLSVMSENGLTPTLVNLEWGKQELIRRGEIQPMDNEDGITYETITFGQPVTPQPRQRTSRGGGVPPVPQGTGSRTEPEAVDANTMPLKDLEALLRKKGALQF